MSRHSLFSAFGVELEYMIVDAQTLDVRPICDQLLKSSAGEFVSEIESGSIAWSNELALHVVELKTNGPADSLAPLPALFHEQVQKINTLLEPLNARLMPTAMHPWMDPHREMRLWPHEYSPVYEAFNRIFDCRGHGWANLQSIHINLPFASDEEFGRLHAAIRLVLPLLPGLAASSPVMDGRVTGTADNRLAVYRENARKIPLVSGRIIPERAYSEEEYHATILGPLYAQIAPHDPEGLLQDEFLNARGAIARFSRGAIEIRLLDVQECPLADLAICAVVTGLVKRLAEERWTSTVEQQAVESEQLEPLLLAAIRDGEQARIGDRDVLRHLGINATSIRLGELWAGLIDDVLSTPEDRERWGRPLNVITRSGTLSRRIRQAVGSGTDRRALHQVYGRLCDCLATNDCFDA